MDGLVNCVRQIGLIEQQAALQRMSTSVYPDTDAIT